MHPRISPDLAPQVGGRPLIFGRRTRQIHPDKPFPV
ncbi:hypothetical protein TCAL_15206, partial [Tigriopus californicus]